MSDKYILDENHNPVEEVDLIKWANWFGNADRIVAKTTINPDVEVSTVFLGLDYRFGEGEPLLFETLCFGGKLDQETDRYSTWKKAQKGHIAMIKKVEEAENGKV